MRKSNIPARVDPLPGSARYYANNRASLHELAWRLKCLSDLNKTAMAAALNDRRLMWPTLMMRFTIWLVRKTKKVGSMTAWLMLFTKSVQGRNLAIHVVNDCATWMTDGKDRSDPKNSVGGFNQHEINYIANMLHLTQEGVQFTAEGNA